MLLTSHESVPENRGAPCSYRFMRSASVVVCVIGSKCADLNAMLTG